MKDQLIKPSIEVRRSTNSGYGVFALKNFKKGEVIEECPVIFLKELPSELTNYISSWGDAELYAIPLGYGCVYHRAELPNAILDIDQNNQMINVKAINNLYKGDEIFIYYSAPVSSAKKIKSTPNYRIPKNLFAFFARIVFVIMLFLIIKLALFPSTLPILHLKNPEHSLRSKANDKILITSQLILPLQKPTNAI